MFAAFHAHLRSLRWAAWLGWQIESNWTDPWRFFIYVLIKPLCGVLMLLCMFQAARSTMMSGASPGMFHYIYVSSACYVVIGAVMFGTSWAVITDREHYGMLKYIYLSPVRLRSYLIGRGTAGGVRAALGTIVLLAFGRLLGVPLTLGGIDWAWLAVFLTLGAMMFIALGLILAGATMNMARHAGFLSEGVAGALYLLSGAVFPIAVLPGWLQPVGRWLPPTYWLEGMRRCLLDTAEMREPSLANFGIEQLAAILGVGAAVLFFLAQVIFSWCERRAWRKGKFDETSGY
jgi:ABC-2 type transport system permease protein